MKFMNDIKFNFILIGLFFTSSALISQLRADEASTNKIENQYVKYIISRDGSNLHFIDRQTGQDYCVYQPVSKLAWLIKAGRHYDASAVSYSDGWLTIKFGQSQVSAIIKIVIKEHYFTFEVLSVSDKDVERLAFIDLLLRCAGKTQDVFAGCALALNLQTQVDELPGPQ